MLLQDLKEALTELNPKSLTSQDLKESVDLIFKRISESDSTTVANLKSQLESFQ